VVQLESRLNSDISIIVPDLAFSEMDFLQRSSKHVSSMKEDKISTKSREKEKRKAARAQDEISAFFKPNKTPLQPISLNKGSIASSNHAKDRRSGTIYRLGRERSRSFDFLEKPNVDFGRTKPSSDIFSASVGRSPAVNRPENVPASTSKLSGRASTYISWSETQLSREAKSRDLNKIDRTRSSSTPESIRRSLENTGIFRDTGISMARRRVAIPSQAYERPSKRDQARATKTLVK
jgi:hypothetical protein